MVVSRPVIAFLGLATRACLRLLGLDGGTEPAVTEEDIRGLLREGARTGVLEHAERDIIERLLRLTDRPLDVIMEEKLGIRGKVVQDVNAACCGWIYGLEMARAIVSLHPEAKVLLAAAEVLTCRTNWADRRTCVLFGDAAAATVITAGEPTPGAGRIVDTRLSSDGSLGHLLTIKGGGSGHPYKLGDTVDEDYFLFMNGREVYKHAVRNMHVIAAKAVAFGEALKPAFKTYQGQVIKNCQVLAKGLLALGYDLVSGGTDNHLVLVDLTNKDVTGKDAEHVRDA